MDAACTVDAGSTTAAMAAMDASEVGSAGGVSVPAVSETTLGCVGTAMVGCTADSVVSRPIEVLERCARGIATESGRSNAPTGEYTSIKVLRLAVSQGSLVLMTNSARPAPVAFTR